MRSATLMLLLLTLVSACGKTNSYSRKDLFLNASVMEELIKQQTIFCSDEKFCPEGIARMFAVNFESNELSSQCSAFLVTEDMVMTNSHCIWTGDISLKETCEGLYFAFPTTLGQTQTAGCSEILWRDRRQNGRHRYRIGDNDFALVRLNKKVSVRPLNLSEEIQVGQTVYPLVIDHFDSYMARATKLSCQVQSVDAYGVAVLKDCPIISGNSGSAVMDENHNVVAIVFASDNTHIRRPTDELSIRTQGPLNEGKAHTISHIKKVMGKILQGI